MTPDPRLLAGAAALVLAATAAAVRVTPAEPPPARELRPVEEARQGVRVLRHPDPSAPLRERWEWAEREGARAARDGWWVAYSIRRPLREEQVVIHDTRGFDLAELDDGRATLGEVLGAATGPGELAVMLHFTRRGAAGVDRVSVRSLRVGMDFGASPVLWLGGADDDASFALLRELVPGLRGDRLRSGGVEAVALHAGSERVVPFLRDVLRGRESEEVRAQAAEGLAWHPRPDALALLEAAVREDRSERVRMEAAEAMGEMELPAATQALRRIALGAGSVDVRREAVEALGAKAAAEALPVLDEVLAGGAPEEVMLEAVEAMGDLRDGAGVPRLERLAWDHPSPAVQLEAAETLGDGDPGRVLPLLEALIARHPSAAVQGAATEALADLHARSVSERDGHAAAVLQALVRVARTHPDPAVRVEAAEALGDLRGGDDDAAAGPSTPHEER